MATFNGNHAGGKITNNIFKGPLCTVGLCTFVLHLNIKIQGTVSLCNLMTHFGELRYFL